MLTKTSGVQNRRQDHTVSKFYKKDVTFCKVKTYILYKAKKKEVTTMPKKNVYFYKVVIQENPSGQEIPMSTYKTVFSEMFQRECRNGSLKLTYDQYDPMLLDVLDDTDEYLFARLSRKRPNHSMHKRNYNNFTTTEVLAPDEIASNGIECFTYCILGYTHGVLSIVKSKGAPGIEAFSMLFAMHNTSYSLDCLGIPNGDLINELVTGRAPEVNRVNIDIARPNAQLLQSLFGFNDEEVITAMSRKAISLAVDVKPDFRGCLMDDPGLISRLVNAFRNSQDRFNSIKLSGKKDGTGGQKEYDLYEEYFKYPIDIKEYRREGGQRIELDKTTIQRDYRLKMTNLYNQYRTSLLAFADRL